MANDSVPYSQIVDAHKLDADGYVSLYRLFPLVGGEVDVKSGPEFQYQGILYESLPVTLKGEKWAVDGSTPTPRFIIGQPDLDLLPFKGLINDGYLEGARLTRYKVLLEDMLADVNSKRVTHFKIKRPESYNRTSIVLLLSTDSGAVGQTYPFRQYIPPAFPWVKLT